MSGFGPQNWAGPPTSIQDSVPGSYMHAVFKLVANKESEIRTSLSQNFTKEAYYSFKVSRVCVAAEKVKI